MMFDMISFINYDVCFMIDEEVIFNCGVWMNVDFCFFMGLFGDYLRNEWYFYLV